MEFFRKLLTSNTDSLTDYVRQQAASMGFAEHTEIKTKTWKKSIAVITQAMLEALDKHGLDGLALSPELLKADEPLSLFAQKTSDQHEQSEASLAMFLGMLKVYRSAYIQLISDHASDLQTHSDYNAFMVRFFDRAEIAQCVYWTKNRNENQVKELSANHEAMTYEKDRFLTLFNSLATPVFLLDQEDRVELMNETAVDFLGGNDMPENLRYACPETTDAPMTPAKASIALIDAIPWLADELHRSCPIGDGRRNCRFDVTTTTDRGQRHFNISVSNLSGISKRFSGTTVVIDDITMRVEAERQLAHERNMAADYLDVVGSVVIAMDASGGIMLLNKTGHQILGYDEGELVGHNWIDTVVPIEERNDLREYFHRIVTEDIELDDLNTNFVQTKNGNLRLIEWRNRLLRNEEGLAIGILASGLDITSQREMEDALAEKEAWLRNTFVALGEGVLILSPDNMIIDANPAAEIIFQMSNQEICDLPIEDLHVDRAHFVEFDQRIQHAFSLGRTAIFEFSMRRKDGSEFPTEHSISQITGDDGTILGTVSALRDISARKQREQILRQSEEKFRRIFETIEEGFIVCSLKGAIQMINPATCRLLGYTEAELLGQDMGQLYSNADERQRLIAKLKATGEVHGIHLTALTKTGKTIIVEANAHMVFDEDGTPAAIEGTFRDITARLEADKMLREREKQYRAFFENNHAIMLLEDPKTGEIMDANPAASEFYGYTVKEMRSMSTGQINAFSEEEIFQEMFRARNENRSYFIFKQRLANGEIRDVEVYSGPIMVRGNQLLYSVIHDVTERIRLENEMKRMATTDALTGANNRHQFFQLAEQELKRTQRYGHPLSVMMLDIDYFKSINDTHGHQTGDVVLKALSALSQGALRETDIFGRLGGEEFAAILPETDLDGAAQVADRLREDLSKLTVRERETEVNFTVSIGVATAEKQDRLITDILNRADEALYKAKRGGRNKVERG